MSSKGSWKCISRLTTWSSHNCMICSVNTSQNCSLVNEGPTRIGGQISRKKMSTSWEMDKHFTVEYLCYFIRHYEIMKNGLLWVYHNGGIYKFISRLYLVCTLWYQRVHTRYNLDTKVGGLSLESSLFHCECIHKCRRIMLYLILWYKRIKKVAHTKSLKMVVYSFIDTPCHAMGHRKLFANLPLCHLKYCVTPYAWVM